jgi:putative membrane protein
MHIRNPSSAGTADFDAGSKFVWRSFKMNRFLSLSAAALVASAAIVALPVGPNSSLEAQRRGVGGRMALAYVAKAGAADRYEIDSSRLAMARARRQDVRDFARMLVADHNRTTRQVAAAARADGLVPLPPVLEPTQRAMIRQLERTGRPGFDSAYLSQQITAHQQALALHRTEARSGTGELRRVATGAVPVVQGHLNQARRLARGR